MGHDVPVYNDPDRFGIDIYVTESGDAAYRRRDGKDWDFHHLHETYYAKNDLRWIESGAALFYAKRRRDLVPRLTARNVESPPGFVRPGAGFETLSVPPTNGFHTFVEDDTTFAFVGRAARLQRFVDFGLLASRPMEPEEPIAGEGLQLAAGQ